jgi:hypothetical protein
MKVPLRLVFVVLGLMGMTAFAQLPEIPPELPRNPKGRIDTDDYGLDRAIQVTATVQATPPRITLTWPTKGLGTAITVYRKAKDATSWGTAIATLASDATSYADSTVAVETGYEYMVHQGTSYSTSNPLGYVYAGINLPKVHARGKVILLVAGSQSRLGAAQTLLERDLIGDNWEVIRHFVPPNATVPQVKALIQADYDADPTNVRAVYILGHVPVPYSGNIAPDGHGDHAGAWPADGFYGDMNGTWTDTTVTTTTASRSENRNVPLDGKYDQSSFSGANALELYIGRVDLFNMPAFAQTETQLLVQYVNKAHAFRVGTTGATARGLVDDNFNFGEGFSQSGWRVASLVGTANVAEHEFSGLRTDDYLWAYGAGGGWYTSASGIANTSDFAAFTYKAMFYMLFGSYFGDWDSQNNFLRAPLCDPTYGLTNAWAGRPHWFFHHMGLGETVGYALLPSTTSGIYASGGSMTSIHIALMGDPTLRLKYVKPPTGARATIGRDGEFVHLAWTASDEPGDIAGYYIYRAASINDPFTLLTPSLVTEATYDDVAPLPGSNIYHVQAVKLETNDSGSFYNNSIGAFTQQINFGNWMAPGLVVALNAADVNGLATPGKFFLKPSFYGIYVDPLVTVVAQQKPKKASLKVLTKIVKTVGATFLECEWTKKVKLYNGKNLKAAMMTGTDVETWLAIPGNQNNLDFSLYVASKEANPASQRLVGASLMAPEVLTVTESPGGDLGTLLTIEGNWFGTKKPKVWREYRYRDAKTGYDAFKQQMYKVLSPNDPEMVDSKNKPSCMNHDTGVSKVVVVVPTKPPPGTLTGTLVLDNGVGMDTGTDPTVPE